LDNFGDRPRGQLPIGEELEDAAPDGIAEDVESVHGDQGTRYDLYKSSLKGSFGSPADAIHIRIPIEGAHIGLLAEGAGSSGQVADRWIYTDSAAARCNRRGRGLP